MTFLRTYLSPALLGLCAILIGCQSSPQEASPSGSPVDSVVDTQAEAPQASTQELIETLGTTTDTTELAQLVAWATQRKIAEAIPALRARYTQSPFRYDVFVALHTLGDSVFLQGHPTDSIPYFREEVWEKVFRDFNTRSLTTYEGGRRLTEDERKIRNFLAYCRPSFIDQYLTEQVVALSARRTDGAQEKIAPGDTLWVLKQGYTEWGPQVWALTSSRKTAMVPPQIVSTLPLTPKTELLVKLQRDWQAGHFGALPSTASRLKALHGGPAEAELPMGPALFEFFAGINSLGGVSLQLTDLNNDSLPEVYYESSWEGYEESATTVTVYGPNASGKYQHLGEIPVAVMEVIRCNGAWTLLTTDTEKVFVTLHYEVEEGLPYFRNENPTAVDPINVYGIQGDSLARLHVSDYPQALAWVQQYLKDHPDVAEKFEIARP